MAFFDFFRPKAAPAIKVVPNLYVGLLLILGSVVHVRPSVGLAGLGVLLVIIGVQILANRTLIWDGYVRNYHVKTRSVWTQPRHVYYTLNVWLVWPLVVAIGIASIAASLYVTP